MSDLYLIIAVIIIGFAALIYYLNQKLSTKPDSQSQHLLEEWLKANQQDLKNELKHLQSVVTTTQTTLSKTLQTSDKNVTDTLQKSYTELNQRLDTAAKVIGELKTETGKFSEIGRSMQSLQDFLTSPKLRGNIGEQILTDLLAQVLPQDVYVIQYRFTSGDTVDAVIKTQAGLIPIDSKFPMENYLKMSAAETKKEAESHRKVFISDVKKHLKVISHKYINTAEETIDFALMYTPSESVYYEITANTPELSSYAQSVRVLPVSPSTFYAFLKTIMVSFEGQRIAKEAQSIVRSLKDIKKSAADFSGRLDILGKHVTNAYNNMNAVSSDFNRLHSKIDETQALGSGLNQTKDLPEKTGS